jgi:hypothetical protein
MTDPTSEAEPIAISKNLRLSFSDRLELPSPILSITLLIARFSCNHFSFILDPDFDRDSDRYHQIKNQIRIQIRIQI